MRRLTVFLIILSLLFFCAAPAAADEVSALKKQVEELRQKVAELEGEIGPRERDRQRRAGASVWNPLTEMEHIQREMNRMFRNAFGREDDQLGFFTQIRPFDLETDIKETGSHYVVEMDVPGMDEANINVEVKDNMVIVSGERDEVTKKQEEEDGVEFFRKERSFGAFSRSIVLPRDADPDQVSADYDQGVLTIKVSKTEKASAEDEKGKIIKVN